MDLFFGKKKSDTTHVFVCAAFYLPSNRMQNVTSVFLKKKHSSCVLGIVHTKNISGITYMNPENHTYKHFSYPILIKKPICRPFLELAKVIL